MMKTETQEYAEIKAAAEYVRHKLGTQPSVGLILGSGLSSLADDVASPSIIPYDEIPYFPASSVKGHAGRLVVGNLAGQSVLVMQGRAHFYEGHSMHKVTLPVRMMQALGIDTLIVTNASGGLNPGFSAGDLMLITDHINFVGMAGHHPLLGTNEETLGPRFPDMSQTYDPALMELARQVSRREDIPLREGVYIYLSGPSFETPAEIRALRILGADAVGMSTVPEVTVARHGGLRILGVSGITPDQQTTHTEVLETGKLIAPRLIKLLRGVLEQLPPAQP
jgi:purine-nucleoside phosphorylase